MTTRSRITLSLRITDTQGGAILERTFDHFPVRIGRSALNDLQLDFKFVSQFHALLEKTESGSVSIRDLGSRNGTHVGDRPAQPHQRIDLAQTGYVFEIGPLRIQSALGTTAMPVGDERTAVMVALSENPATQNATEMWQAIVEAPAPQGGRDARDAALMGLRQLAATYLPDADPLTDAESVLRFLNKVKQALDLLFGAFIPMRDGARQVQLRSDAAAREGGEGWTAAASARTAYDLAEKALDWTDPSNEVLRAIQNAFADFIIHQVGIVDGVVRGVGTLLGEFSKEAITGRFTRMGSSMRFGAFREAALFRVSVDRQRELLDNAAGALTAIFGDDFVRAFSERSQGNKPS